MDPDGDALSFRFGNKLEMGGITRSKTEVFPFSQNAALSGQARNSYDITGKILANVGIEYGPYECDSTGKSFSLTSTCPTDRETETISGVDSSFLSSVPGLVEWNTWTAGDGSPCPSADGFGCSKLRAGFYNMVVMVSDDQVKVPVDFMAYLYDGPLYFCGKNCRREAGLPTHANLDGVYGNQGCSVCGYGEGNMTASMCTPDSADGECGLSQSVWNAPDQVLETSIVPNPTLACKMNTPPKFATTGLVNNILNNPRLDMYEAAVENPGLSQKPSITKHLGEGFEFYVTAVDTDDCADLSIEGVGLPVGATLGAPEMLKDFDEYPQGAKVRRKFTWTTSEAVAANDPRPRDTLACFYATDKYLATAEPYYCIELHLKPQPMKAEETLLRFNCKLALNWQPDVKRFVVVEGSSRHYTATSYDDYMWHHAMVSIDDSGLGKLYVDGAAQDLEIGVGIDSSDSTTFNKGTAIGNFFYAVEYPNNCEDTVSARRNLQMYASTNFVSNVQSYVEVDNTLDSAGTSCCSFRMGSACADDSTTAFDGLIDEVAVWNRGLNQEEVASTLFHMPKNLQGLTLEAPRGDQVDYSSGRALYTRFNNPCTEGPALSTKVSDQLGGAAYYGSSEDSATSDLADDGATMAADAKYAYTGVPWAAPSVTHTTVDDSTLPIDGGVNILLKGLGFAKSPFMKCVSGIEMDNSEGDYGKYEYGYRSENASTLVTDGPELGDVMVSPATVTHQQNDDLPFLVVESKRHPAQKTYVGAVRSDWVVTDADKATTDGGNMRFGNIPPFQTIADHSSMPSSNLRDSFVYGFYETALCSVPNGINPAKDYYLGVSNDAGVSGSPQHEAMTYSEYSMKTSATASVKLTVDATGFTFAMWFLPESSGDATLMLLTNNLALLWQGGAVRLTDSSNLLSASSALALDEWHHVAIVIQNDNVVMYADGEPGSPSPVASALGGYSLVNFVNGLVGYVDELKILKEAVPQDKIFDLMFTRYASFGDVYYRFNDNLGYIATPLQTAVTIVPVAVPWEPIIIESATLDGAPLDDLKVVGVSMAGGEEIVVNGFNIAASKWLKCNFGTFDELSLSVGQGRPSQAHPPPSDTTSASSPIGQASLSRPDGKEYSAVDYGLQKIDRTSPIVTSDITKLSESSFKCTVPEFETVQGVTLGFGEIVQDELSIDVMESALVCDGTSESFADGFASSSSIIETNYNGYTMSLWAMPKASASPTPQTVLAFQSSSAKSAMITYDGSKFAYFDDKILEVAPRNATNSPVSAWAHVAVTVTGDGEGVLYLDGHAVETSTTTSVPFPAHKLTLCASLGSGDQGEAFFTGLVDNVFVFKGALSAEDVKSLSETADTAADVVEAEVSAGNGVSFFYHKSGEDTNFDAKAMGVDKTHSAWNAPTTFDVTPSSVPLQGGVSVTLVGANYDPLTITVDFGEVTAASTTEVTANAFAQSQALSGQATVQYAPQEVELASGLLAHYTMDRRFYNNGTGKSTIFDASGNGHDIEWTASPPWTADSNGEPDKALGVSPTLTGLFGNIETPFAAGLTEATICAFMRVEFTSDVAAVSSVGGFKMYSLTISSSTGTQVYVNERKATLLEIAAFEGSLKSVFSGTLLSGISAIVDEVWIYSRALSHEEVAYRYALGDYAVDLGKTSVHVKSAATALPSLSSYELWLKTPEDLSKSSTILKTSSFEIGLSTLDGFNGSLSIIANNSDSACTCTSCLAFEEYTSWKASLGPDKWVHLGIDVSGKTMLVYVDGVLADDVTFSQDLDDLELMAGGDLILIGDAFEGLLYDLRLNSASKRPANYKNSTQCPSASMSGDVYFPLNSGNAVEYATTSDLYLEIPSKTAWTDASFDDDADLGLTSFYGPGLFSATSGSPGRYAITAHTSCGRKRKTGGDNFEVEFTYKPDGTKTTISAMDSSDGNYLVSYTGLQCGAHAMAISSNGTLVQSYDVDISPNKTSTAASYITDITSSVAVDMTIRTYTIGCFGSVARFYIQSMDDFGCKSGIDGTDLWSASVVGPDSFVVNGVHTKDGLYEIAFVPPAAGSYVVRIQLGSSSFEADGTTSNTAALQPFCVDVCQGSSQFFYGNTGVEFADAGNAMSLEGNTGLTMEAWVKPLSDSGADAYILVKDSYDNRENYIKGYDMKITDSLSTLSASVYVGLGEIRDISAPLFALTSWTHLCVVYSGTEMNVYVNGDLKASKPFAESKPVHANPYSHPLTVGFGYSGLLDEVKVVSYGMSADQVKESMYCPPVLPTGTVARSGLEKNRLVAYLGFNNANEEGSPTALGENPAGTLVTLKGAAIGPKPVGQLTTSDTPYSSAFGEGVGTIGAAYTNGQSGNWEEGIHKAQVTLRDNCGFSYNGNDKSAVQVTYNRFHEKYLKMQASHEIGPSIDGGLSSMYSPFEQVCGIPIGNYESMGVLEEAGNYSATISVGGEVAEVGSFVVSPGQFAKLDVIQGALANVTAGVRTLLGFSASDSFGNPLGSSEYLHKLSVDLSQEGILGFTEGGDAGIDQDFEVDEDGNLGGGFILDDSEAGLDVHFHTPGVHTIVIEAQTYPQATTHTLSVFVEPSATWYPLFTEDMVVPSETNRKEHTAVVYDEELYIWGGSTSDSAYRSDMYKLSEMSLNKTLAYMRVISVPGLAAATASSDAVVELTLNTLELIGMSRMTMTCDDMIFTLPNNIEPSLYFHMMSDPGCMAENSKVFIRVPQGSQTDTLEFYYGTNYFNTFDCPQNDGKMAFDFFEDFDGEAHAFAAKDACTLGEDSSASAQIWTWDLMNEDLDYYTKTALDAALEGSQGNKVLGVKTGDSVLLHAPASKTLESYRLLATMYDADSATASHWISPNYNGCAMDFVGAGVHTLSHASKYCTASPWKASSLGRTQGGRQVEIIGTPDSTTITIDGVAVKQEASGSVFDGVTLSSGFGLVNESKHGSSDLANSYVAFDDICVMPYSSGLAPVVSTGAENDVQVGRRPRRNWSPVSTVGSPSARAGQAGALLGDTYYIFGGERSGYAFSDLWSFDFASKAFDFVEVTTSSPPGRSGHAAVSLGTDTLVVMGAWTPLVLPLGTSGPLMWSRRRGQRSVT